MAFVPALSIFSHRPFSTSLISCRARNIQPSRYHRTAISCVTQPQTKTQKPEVRLARNPHELHLVYSLWNKVLESDELSAIAPDDIDSASSTIHLLAYTSNTITGAARLLRIDENARLDRVWVHPEHRGKGVGRALVENLLVLAAPVQGAVFVNATHGELGFFSIMGFESLGNDKFENMHVVRTMVFRFPVCAPSAGCVGLHHTSIRVYDIEQSLAFYGSLGFFVTEKFLTSGGQRACFVEGLGTRLEFVESPDGMGGLQGVQGVPPAGFDRLVFDVTKACTDLDSYLSHLQRRNGGMLQVSAEPARQVVGSDVVSVACVSDPDGLPIEFIRHEAQVPGELRTRIMW